MPRMPPVTSATWPVMSPMLRSPLFKPSCGGSGVDVQEKGLALAAAAAERGGAETTAAPAELEGQVQRDPGAGGADRVAHGDRAAVDVDVARVDPQVLHRLQRHRGERLVDLVKVDVARRLAGPAERLEDRVG